MIKRERVMIKAVVFMTVLSLLFFDLAEATPIPTIELKDTKLRGTAISGIFNPIAIVEDTKTNQNYWYKVGDTLCGGKIIEIRRGAVVLEMNGGLYQFGLPEGELEGIAFSQEERIILGQKVGDNIWKVKQNTAIDILTRVSKIMKEVKIKPYFAIGKAAGIRLDRIEEGSVVKDMGLKDGDIIKGVNGFSLMSPTKIFEAYRRYKNDRSIKVQLIRDDEPVTLTYDIVR